MSPLITTHEPAGTGKVIGQLRRKSGLARTVVSQALVGHRLIKIWRALSKTEALGCKVSQQEEHRKANVETRDGNPNNSPSEPKSPRLALLINVAHLWSCGASEVFINRPNFVGLSLGTQGGRNQMLGVTSQRVEVSGRHQRCLLLRKWETYSFCARQGFDLRSFFVVVYSLIVEYESKIHC